MGMTNKPYFDTWKCITLNFERPTMRAKYLPVRMTGEGSFGATVATSDSDVVVGVLMEEFAFPNVPTRVCVSGIVKMQTSEAVQPGDIIAAGQKSGAGVGCIQKAVAGKFTFGTVITSGAKGDYVSVLLGNASKLAAGA